MFYVKGSRLLDYESCHVWPTGQSPYWPWVPSKTPKKKKTSFVCKLAGKSSVCVQNPCKNSYSTIYSLIPHESFRMSTKFICVGRQNSTTNLRPPLKIKSWIRPYLHTKSTCSTCHEARYTSNKCE